METMPAILLFWMVSLKDYDLKEIKKIENYECKIFLDEDDDFTWACADCDRYECRGCSEEQDDD